MPETEEKPESRSKYLTLNGEPVDESVFAGWVTKQATEHPVVLTYHGRWKELLEWEDGNQFSLWDQTSKTVRPVELRVRKKMIVVNFMKPLVETIESKINLQYSVIGSPNSSEMSDIKGSAVATKLLAYNDQVNSIEDLMEEMKYDLVRPGDSCVKWVWDKSVKGKIAPRENGRPNTEKTAEEPGEVIGSVVNIFNVRPDPVAKKPEDLRWVIELIELNEEDLLTAFPDAESFLGDLYENLDSRYIGMNEDLREKDKDEKSYVIKEYWERKSDKYPRGRYIVTCANRVLHAGPSPAARGMLPYFWFFYKFNKRSFWSHGPLFYVQDLQREFNRLVSIQSEAIEAWRPKVLVGKGALLRNNSITMDDFEIVEVDFSRGEPRPMAMPQESPAVAALRDFFLASKDMVSNVHEVSYSRLPQYASRAPASLYDMMLATENEKLDPLIRHINKVIIDMARYRLMLMDEHYDRPRMVRVLGENKKSSIEYFDKSDLSENFDVQLEIGASINQSQAVQAKMLFELWDKGIFTADDRNRVIRTLNFGSAENDFLTDVIDSDRAMRENQLFMDGKGDEVKIYLHDDHKLHLQYHTNLAKTEEAENWDEAEFAKLDKHIMDHLILYQNLQAQSAPTGETAAGPGATPGPPGSEMTPGGPGEPTGQPPGPPPEAGAMEGGAPL